MFDDFCKDFNTSIKKLTIENEYTKRLEPFKSSIGAIEFMLNFHGMTFKDGLYRVHSLNELDKWNRIAIDTFPFLSNRIQCFAYDWLGRQFVLDFKRKIDNEPMILMLEVGTGEVLEMPCTFKSFHEEELIEYQDAAIATEFFNEWNKENGKRLEHNKCVGYKVPLFLGGKDSINNLEVNDMDVYWGTIGQLIRS